MNAGARQPEGNSLDGPQHHGAAVVHGDGERNHRYLPLARMSADDGEGSSVVEAGGQSQPGPVQDRVWDFPSLTF
jgi:hypothetical protein